MTSGTRSGSTTGRASPARGRYGAGIRWASTTAAGSTWLSSGVPRCFASCGSWCSRRGPSCAAPASPEPPMDLDLHGFAGIRVTGGTAADHAAVEADLGPLPQGLDREPDIDLRFVPRLDAPPLRLLGKDDAGYAEDGF